MVKLLLKKQLSEIFRSYFYNAKQGKARQPQQQRTELPERFVPSARCRARKVQPVPFFSSGMPHGAPPAFRSLFFSTTICLPAPC